MPFKRQQHKNEESLYKKTDDSCDLNESPFKRSIYLTGQVQPSNIEITTNKVTLNNQDLEFDTQDQRAEVLYAAIQPKAYGGLEITQNSRIEATSPVYQVDINFNEEQNTTPAT